MGTYSVGTFISRVFKSAGKGDLKGVKAEIKAVRNHRKEQKRIDQLYRDRFDNGTTTAVNKNSRFNGEAVDGPTWGNGGLNHKGHEGGGAYWQ